MISIIGAGLAGCMAGSLFRNSVVFEAGPEKETHKALLRFRSNTIGDALGIEFRKVKVYKGIWHNDQIVQISPRYINLYSRKVSDTLSYRSICHQETVERYIAPNDFHQQMKEKLGSKIEYNSNISDVILDDSPTISTIPIHCLASILKDDSIVVPESKYPSIYVNKYTVESSDVYLTYYYTDPTTPVYRASITGDELIIESTFPLQQSDYNIVKRSFGLDGMVIVPTVRNYEQLNGKIVPIDDDTRKQFIVRCTDNDNVYSLGRFATWRNLILDDVYKDISVIKTLMNKSRYDQMVKK